MSWVTALCFVLGLGLFVVGTAQALTIPTRPYRSPRSTIVRVWAMLVVGAGTALVFAHLLVAQGRQP